MEVGPTCDVSTHLLENVDKCDNPSAVVKYTAITRFFRAYFYFDKVVRFGDVPWYDTSDRLYQQGLVVQKLAIHANWL